ncbi:MAG TPA: hypothetical protein VFE23_18680 [Usitatibacter sp.]|jgi:hypothetical protein|nr:hypothetical protein [Usitatibacter sp.]
MRDLQREKWTVAMRDHERSIAQLSLALATIDPHAAGARRMREDVLVLTAQLMKHRISLALLASRLDVPEAFAH